MARQSHDLGVQKRRRATPPLLRDRLRWLRMKRRHPGPLPAQYREYAAWVKAGKPRRVGMIEA